MTQKKVVGVSYEPGYPAPLVILKGAGQDATAILERATCDADVPVISDPNLVAQLYRIPLDGAVGAELFPVMAALLVHVLHVDQRLKEIRE
jgi:type III secretion system FlhB-like substrate exporter